MAAHHIDYAAPKYGYTRLVFVNENFKFPGRIPLTITTACATCNALLKILSHFGMPIQFVFDNEPTFDNMNCAILCQKHD